MTDYSTNLVYLMLLHDLQIVKVLKIVQFKSYRIFHSYYEFLQLAKGKCDSKITTKLLKSISNNLNGKMHAQVCNILNTSLCLSAKQFKKEIEKDTFFDFRYLSENCCVIIKDKLSITCKQPIQIPAAIYSISKLRVFHGYLYLVARMAKFGQFKSRAVLSDTDSYVLAHSRPKTEIEHLENERLLKTRQQIPYHISHVGQNYIRAFLLSTAPVFDFSSIDQVS